MSDKNPPPSDDNARASLLDELQSIKGLLDENPDLPLDDSVHIPTLDDVVDQSSDEALSNDPESDLGNSTNTPPPNADIEDPLSDTELLDLDSIFDDDNDTSSVFLDELSDEHNAEPPHTLNLDNLELDVDIPDFTLDASASDDVKRYGMEKAANTASSDGEPTADLPLGEKYQEHQSDLFNAGQKTAFKADHDQPISDLDLNLIIQEIVDECLPMVEDELRQRLSKLSPDLIQQFAAKLLQG